MARGPSPKPLGALNCVTLTAALLVGLASIVPGARASDVRDACDPKLTPPQNDTRGYKMRGDRCEGTYVQPVAGTVSIQVASLTDSFGDYDPTTASSLEIAWKQVPGDVHVRAYGLRAEVHYRMDALLPPGSSGYRWPTALVTSLEMGKKDLGLVAWTSRAVGEQLQEVYLPVRVGPVPTARASGPYELVIVPSLELTEVFVGVTARRDDGSARAILRPPDELGYHYYPASRGIHIKIAVPDTEPPTVYSVEIGATLRRGGSTTATVWLWHPGA